MSVNSFTLNISGSFVNLRLGAFAHVRDLQIFNVDSIVSIYQAARQFVLEVSSLVGNLAMPGCHLLAYLVAAIRATNATGQRLLFDRQIVRAQPEEAGVGNLLTIRQGGELLQAHVYANFALDGNRGNLLLDFNAKAGTPVFTFALDGYGFNPALDWAVQLNLERTNLAEGKYIAFQLPACDVRVGEAVEPPSTLIAGEACLLTALDTAKEGLKRLVQTAQGILQHMAANLGIFGQCFFNLWKLVGLVVIADAYPAHGISQPSLGQRIVVQGTQLPQHPVKFARYLFAGVEDAIFECFTNEHLYLPLPQFDVLANGVLAHIANAANVETPTPKITAPKLLLLKLRKLLEHLAGGDSLQRVGSELPTRKRVSIAL